MIARRDFLLGTIASSVLPARTRADFTPDDELRTILQDRIDRARQSVGIVASSFDSGRRQRIAAYGRSGVPNDRPLDGDTVFEIGSITKVFTALLLTEMVTHGEVALDDPVSKYLPGNVKVPARNGKQITFLTHPVCRGFRMGYRTTVTIRTRPTPLNICMHSSPIMPCGSIRARIMSMPIWDSACSGMCSH